MQSQKTQTQKRSVLIAGGTGNVGAAVVAAFLDHKSEFKAIRVLSRSSSEKTKALEAKGAEIVIGDSMDIDSLTRVFQTCGDIDVVVSTLSGEAIYQGQLNLIKAAAAAKHKVVQFLPSEFGADLSAQKKKEAPLFGGKYGVAQALGESGLGWTRIMTGFFPETTFGEYGWLGMNLSNGEIKVAGDGNQKASYTTIADVGRYTVEAVLHPEVSLNKVIKVAGDIATINEVIGWYEQVNGEKKKVKVNYYPLEELRGTVKSAAHPFDKIQEQIILTLVNGDALFTDLDNNKFPTVKPTTIKEYFESISASPSK